MQPADRGPRCEEVLSIPLGTVIEAPDGRRWVFYGWGSTTTGRVACLKRDAEGHYLGQSEEMDVAFVRTLIRRLPAVQKYLTRILDLHQETRFEALVRTFARIKEIDHGSLLFPIDTPQAVRTAHQLAEAELEQAAEARRAEYEAGEDGRARLAETAPIACALLGWALDPSIRSLRMVEAALRLHSPLPPDGGPPPSGK